MEVYATKTTAKKVSAIADRIPRPAADKKGAVSKLMMQQGPSRSEGLGGPPCFWPSDGIFLDVHIAQEMAFYLQL